MGDVRVEQRGGVLVGTLENPPHGLMDAGMVAALEALVTRAERDDAVRGVVLTGAHPERFVAHYDVAELLAGAQASPAVSPGVALASLRAVGRSGGCRAAPTCWSARRSRVWSPSSASTRSWSG